MRQLAVNVGGVTGATGGPSQQPMFVNNCVLGMDSVADHNCRFNYYDLWPVNVTCHEKELVQVNFGEEVTFSLTPLNLDNY